MTRDMQRIELSALTPGERRRLTVRHAMPDPSVVTSAAAIVESVADSGDAALASHAERHGGALADGTVAVPLDDLGKAAANLSPRLEAALRNAIENVRTVHEPQRPVDDRREPQPGVEVARLWTPLRSVGVYVPGGRAVYPSSLIMGAVPALVAGVRRIVVATPAGPEGQIDEVVLATAHLLGITEMYAMGGAQAVGALAYGTESIERVDKIVGPGGPWVTAAKLAVYGVCGIDLPAGPSEAAVVADAHADPRIVAADVMCQAEHGDESSVALVVTDPALADAVVDEIERMIPTLSRGEIIRTALDDHGLIVVAEDVGDALRFADEWAPEHLSIHTHDAATDAAAVPSAGSVFVGHWTPEAAGDYATGANHVLPTGGLARAYGPLSVEDFGSWRQVQHLDRRGLEELAPTIETIAHAEGFTAHAHAVTVRLEAPPT
ncbi:MAG: histidinol dehydrogenase [Acidimicrobiia bacterium]|nr:histidinol dehydrogenase [Acidimicrobiia bacterium]